ncbi:MAG: thioredoxin family protein [Flavobacteriaceae bacterium]|nr:thioredoxin family protein [Flavobacteriaceae bacterium]
MKKILLGLLFISTIITFSQEVIWLTNFDEAAKISQKTNKPILANFTGSDWCGYCKILNRDVFSQPEFAKWAKKNVVLLELDFPKKTKLSPELKKQNYALQKAFNVRGYPTIWLFEVGKGNDPKKELNPLGKTGYIKGGPKKWINSIDRYM